MQRHACHLVNERLNNGSGLQLSEQLRWFLADYANRMWTYGPDHFPTSFNVIEAFMTYDSKYHFFNLRKETDYLFSIDDYFDWYTSGEIPNDPGIIADILPEGVVISYNALCDANGFRINRESQQVIAGIALVRHEYELSCMLLGGENPSLCDVDPLPELSAMTPRPGKENLRPSEDLTANDRYLDGYPTFTKLITLTRFDLRDGKHDVRYVNVDEGIAFRILTDDPAVLNDLWESEETVGRQSHVERLKRYDDLFSCAASLIYLPAFFASRATETRKLNVLTKMAAKPLNRDLKAIIRSLGKSNCILSRTITCLPSKQKSDETKLCVNPPDMSFRSDGYWKPIGPQEVGADKNGEPILGRSWVSRHETWSASSPTEFSLDRSVESISGPDPGLIYVQRSPSHDVDIYKIGLTRRCVEVRAAELSRASGVPLPFGVLAKWEVGDCSLVERNVHDELKNYRINPNREFFHAELSRICSVIDRIVKESADQSAA